MKIGILYDSSEKEAEILFSAVLNHGNALGAETAVTDAGHGQPKDCLGCFGCWIRTPGICVHRDDPGSLFLKQQWDSDYLLIISRVTWGCYSTSIKYYADRMLPLLHPYFRKVKGEMHHKLRYKRMPVILAAGFGAADEEEAELFKNYTNSHRDQEGVTLEKGTFIWTADACEDAAIAACRNWLREATGK